MRSRIFAALCATALCAVLFVLSGHAQDSRTQPKASASEPGSPLKTLQEKASYGIGLNIGKDLKRQALDVDPSILCQGLHDALGGKKARLSDAELREALASFEKQSESKRAANAKELGDKNNREGDDFLAENKKKEGVKTLASGLQYKVLRAGSGKPPKASDTVTTHYRGTLLDGAVFDSSYDRGEPATFRVGEVIPGWREALQLMQPGAKWQLFVPAKLAYGERGAPPDIGPNATLIFEVELLSIK